MRYLINLQGQEMWKIYGYFIEKSDWHQPFFLAWKIERGRNELNFVLSHFLIPSKIVEEGKMKLNRGMVKKLTTQEFMKSLGR